MKKLKVNDLFLYIMDNSEIFVIIDDITNDKILIRDIHDEKDTNNYFNMTIKYVKGCIKRNTMIPYTLEQMLNYLADIIEDNIDILNQRQKVFKSFLMLINNKKYTRIFRI